MTATRSRRSFTIQAAYWKRNSPLWYQLIAAALWRHSKNFTRTGQACPFLLQSQTWSLGAVEIRTEGRPFHMSMSKILITGGAGFIGSNFVLQQIRDEAMPIVNLDRLTYAGNLRTLDSLAEHKRHTFVHGDIADRELVRELFVKHQPKAVVHFAAESHVDRSIRGPEDFIQTNIHGTFALLDEARTYWSALAENERNDFRFLHVSTDEVYGSLGANDPPFCETTPYAPNSPYAASKAASDHLVRAYHHTYGLPTLTTNCSNNYGPYHFPEKLIPLMILNALEGKPLPVYGDGMQIRDWLYVEDHARALD